MFFFVLCMFLSDKLTSSLWSRSRCMPFSFILSLCAWTLHSCNWDFSSQHSAYYLQLASDITHTPVMTKGSSTTQPHNCNIPFNVLRTDILQEEEVMLVYIGLCCCRLSPQLCGFHCLLLASLTVVAEVSVSWALSVGSVSVNGQLHGCVMTVGCQHFCCYLGPLWTGRGVWAWRYGWGGVPVRKVCRVATETHLSGTLGAAAGWRPARSEHGYERPRQQAFLSGCVATYCCAEHADIWGGEGWHAPWLLFS